MSNELTCTFYINVGVKQGDALSAVLFNLALDGAVTKSGLNGYIGIKST